MDLDELRARLFAWYESHGRHALPWRQTRDPYAVLVSEVMLQQTQVERVRPYYERWIERWPTVAALAVAPRDDVIRAWSGLGYNRRAVHLHRAAMEAMARHGGTLPVEPAALRALPGVGPYTANAVACLAGGVAVALVETNIARVLVRAFAGRAARHEVGSQAIDEFALRFLDRARARDHNLALMDIGALLCRGREPGCDACPLAGDCRWRAAGHPPAPAPGRSRRRFEETARFARGRIVEALRHHRALTATELAERLPAAHRDEVGRYLFALAEDGLVEQEGSGWRLAGGQSSSMASPKL